ncbi:phage integrase N-terminal domain-containing protein [Escherichia coli]
MSKLTKRMEKLALLAGGSFKTVHDRLRIAGRLSQHLHKLNIQIQDLQHLKSSHIESYVMARREAGITPRTLQNEMAALRTILAQLDVKNLPNRSASAIKRSGWVTPAGLERICH